NELSMTSVGPDAVRAVVPLATSTTATARAPASDANSAERLVPSLFTASSLLLMTVARVRCLRRYWTSAPATSLARSAGGAAAEPSGCSQHAADRSPARPTSGGSSTLQRENAYGQRGWKRQPRGGCAGSGTSPGRAFGRKPRPSGCGIALISDSL